MVKGDSNKRSFPIVWEMVIYKGSKKGDLGVQCPLGLQSFRINTRSLADVYGIWRALPPWTFTREAGDPIVGKNSSVGR